jgi:hypothetical protein
MDEPFRSVTLNEFCSHQRDLLVLEEREELLESSLLLSGQSNPDLASQGIVVLNLRMDSITSSLFGKTKIIFRHHMAYSRKSESSADLPKHNLSSGDIVGVFNGSFKESPVLTAVLHAVDSKSMQIIPDGEDEASLLNDHEFYHIAKITMTVIMTISMIVRMIIIMTTVAIMPVLCLS